MHNSIAQGIFFLKHEFDGNKWSLKRNKCKFYVYLPKNSNEWILRTICFKP